MSLSPSSKWTSYLSHVRIKHPSAHVCGACGYSFVSRLGLAMHTTMMHKQQVGGVPRAVRHVPHVPHVIAGTTLAKKRRFEGTFILV